MLVVDDTEAVRESVALALAEHEVVEAASGEDALVLFDAAAEQGRPFEAVLTDFNMPSGMDGIELTRRVKERRPATMVGMVSGDRSVCDRAWRAGVEGFLLKPPDVEAIRTMVAGFAQVAGAVARQTA